MANLAEITSLFAKLASELQALDPTASNNDEDLDVTISNLTRWLNLTETPSVSVLDTALSLMCFTAPQVYDKVIEYSVKTMLSVLSSSIECKPLRNVNDEVLRVGGSVSPQDCICVMEACSGILTKLKARDGDLCSSLLYAVIRLAVFVSNFPQTLDSSTTHDASLFARSSAFSKLVNHFPRVSQIKIGETPLRLLYWHLDPNVLKHDISQMLREATERPFLCLSVEIYERTDWRSTVTCLSLSPSMFIETRAMLHYWFLVTGTTSVLKLQTELVSVVLDMSSRPMWWGLCFEVGSKLPFSHAYFPRNHQLLRILAGPLSCEGLQHLVQTISESVSLSGRCLETTSQKSSMNMALVDHTSMWAMIMNFPDWFHFASALLLCDQTFHETFHSYCSEGSSESVETVGPHCTKFNCYSSAARFIAWILNPSSREHPQDLLVDYLTKISEPSTLKCEHKAASVDSMKSYNFQTLYLWLQEFLDMCNTYCRHAYNSTDEAKAPESTGNRQSVLFRRIPLGLIVGCSSYMDEGVCELLLHYAATGTIIQLSDVHWGLRHRKGNRKWDQASIEWTEQYTKKEAVAGASVVFDLTDLTESMSASLFESEEIGSNFLCQVKLKAGKYLFKCIKRLLQIKLEEDVGCLLLKDLHKRVVQWKHQGRDVFQNYQYLNDIVDALTSVSFTL